MERGRRARLQASFFPGGERVEFLPSPAGAKFSFSSREEHGRPCPRQALSAEGKKSVYMPQYPGQQGGEKKNLKRNSKACWVALHADNAGGEGSFRVGRKRENMVRSVGRKSQPSGPDCGGATMQGNKPRA